MPYGGVTEPWKEVHGYGMKSKKCEQLWRGEKWKPPPQHVMADDPEGASLTMATAKAGDEERASQTTTSHTC